MKIKTITCHDVYNLGASLQAYALACFLTELGHEVEIIDYKPHYLRHYELTGVKNPVFDKPVLRELYQVLKFPGRLASQFDPRKKVFDEFTSNYLPITACTYKTNEELKTNTPDADVYIAGSDQIWNPTFQNGKDPSFFLDFVPEGKRKVSYAASFAVDTLETDDANRIGEWLRGFDLISVREKSGIELLAQMGLESVQVCDPVFLLGKEHWIRFIRKNKRQPYCFVYDFDGNEKLWEMAVLIAKQNDLRIVSAFRNEKADKVLADMGPMEFVDILYHADIIISNSFHATAFSIIFEKEFYVVNRKDAINTRMWDLLSDLKLSERLISDGIADIPIDWDEVKHCLVPIKKQSLDYINKCLI